jgi:hypothetical protein
MIILQQVVHLPGSFNLNSQCQIMDKDVKVKPVNHYGLNLHNRHGKLIATAPQVEGDIGAGLRSGSSSRIDRIYHYRQ